MQISKTKSNKKRKKKMTSKKSNGYIEDQCSEVNHKENGGIHCLIKESAITEF